MKNTVVFATIVIGFLLLITSALWSSLFSSSAGWTNEKAQRSAQVKARLVVLGSVINTPTTRTYGGMDPAAAKVEFEALKKENDELNAEFESRANSPKTISKLLRWSGIALAAIGLIGFYAIKQDT